MKKLFFSALVVSIAMLGVGGAAADWGSGPGWEEEVIERTVDLGAGGELEIESVNGSITIEAWDRSEVEIIAHKRARSKRGDSAALLREIEVDIRESAGRLEIETLLPRNKGWSKGTSYGVEYQLRVPREIKVDASSTNGGIDIDGVSGEVLLRTVNGRIDAMDIDGDLEASSTNGGIRARRISGRVDASTTNGGIDAEMLTGSLSQDVEFSTTNGSIELGVDAGLAATIDARTSNGTVSGSLIEGSWDDRRKKSAKFDLNGGGPRIMLRATNGRIRLDRN